MKENDLVRIAKNPENLHVYIQGQVGIIDEILDEYASIDCFDQNGDGSGAGSVPLDCLVLETRAEWIDARATYEQRVEKFYREAMAFSNRVNAGIKKVAEKYNVSVETAKSIHKEIRSLYP